MIDLFSLYCVILIWYLIYLDATMLDFLLQKNIEYV